MGEEIVDALARLGRERHRQAPRSFDRPDRARGRAASTGAPAIVALAVRSAGSTSPKDANASPYLFAADALVTDHSSVGFEFMLLDRPIVVIDCPQLVEHARINTQKVDLLRSAADVVDERRPRSSRPLGRALAQPRRAQRDARTAIAE